MDSTLSTTSSTDFSQPPNRISPATGRDGAVTRSHSGRDQLHVQDDAGPIGVGLNLAQDVDDMHSGAVMASVRNGPIWAPRADGRYGAIGRSAPSARGLFVRPSPVLWTAVSGGKTRQASAVKTTLPAYLPRSMNSWAREASSSGKRSAITGLILSVVASSKNSARESLYQSICSLG